MSLQNRAWSRMGRRVEQAQGQPGKRETAGRQVCRAPALKATAELFCFCWGMRQIRQWGRFPVSNMVKSLGVMRVAKAPAGCCTGWGSWRDSSPRCSASSRGVLDVSFPFFSPLNPASSLLPITHVKATSFSLHHPLGWDEEPSTCAPLQLCHAVKSLGERVRFLGDPLLPQGVHSWEHHSPHHPPHFHIPFSRCADTLPVIWVGSGVAGTSLAWGG